MKLIIHRGTHEIGGSCVEIETDKTRILIDFGMPLVGEKKKGESFSQVIKRKLGPPRASKKLLRLIRDIRPETMRAVKKHLRESRKERAV